MSKPRKKPKKPQKLLHYYIDIKDREAWKSNTMCSGKGSGTFDHAKVTCKKCMTFTNYTPEMYAEQHKETLTFCACCDGGRRILKGSSITQHKIGCDSCNYSEWISRR